MNFGLTGNPLGHSFSKIIHEELFKIKNVDYNYELYPSEDVDCIFEQTLSKLGGFNVTIPYKTDIIRFLDELDEKVVLYNSCNTVVKKDKKYCGYNTDVYGFLNTLKKCDIELDGKKVLVLGSGGVSRMMVFEALLNGAEVYITSRNVKKCYEITDEVSYKINKQISVIEDVDGLSFDIVLNGTPCGMFPNELSLPISYEKIIDAPFIFDTIYNPKETILTKLAAYCGNKAENGLYMLVEQAAVAQKYFCGLEYGKTDVEKVVKSIDISPLSIDKNIILIGPPGSGKSTIGKELAKILNLDFVDTDDEIVKKHGDITEIFATYGEKYFRQLENDIMKNRTGKRNQLISTGGGMIESTEIMDAVKEDKDNIILFINPSFEVLLNRTANNDDRPLLKGDVAEKLFALLKRRLPVYKHYADTQVDIFSEQPIKLTVVKCIDKLCNK